MAEQVVATIVEKLSAVAINELLLLRGVRSDMQYITAHLNMMSAYLRSAEEKPETERDGAARTWAKEVQELAYDAEDCIDEFRLHLGQPTPHGLAGTLQRLARFLCTLKACHRIARQIQDIKSRVEHAKETRSLYVPGGIVPTSNITFDISTTSLDPRMAALFVEEAELVGMEEPRKELIRWLKEKNKPQLGVISVVGMGGLGKTTLVRKVYESRKVSQLFNCRAWITVSKFPIEDLLKDMILQLQIPEQEVKSILQSDSPIRRNRLIEKLREHLEDKRYLIVFDDIWINSAWENIKFALPDSRNGSRVIVTTRMETIANTCCSFFPPYNLQPLSHEQSWELFCKRLFKDTGVSCSLELEDLCRAILKKCNGLPLAIVTIAGLLASKPNKTREEWQRVHDHLGSELETNPGLEGVKQILNLSYDDLPYHLKPCFLYLSKYPEDYEVKRRKVVKLWVAEGFARGTQYMSAEEVADGYFDEFINRSMIQPSKIRWDGKVKNCRVHDMMREVIVSRTAEKKLLWVSSLPHEHETAPPIKFQEKIRRLSISTNTVPNLESTNLSHVRSLTMFGSGDASLIVSPRLRLLRVLELHGDGMQLGKQQLKLVGELIHLKYLYLGVHRRTCFDLPKSWGKLHELETLHCNFDVRLTMTIAKLQKLRHLRGFNLYLPPARRGIGSLKSLQTLGSVHCEGSRGQAMKELGELTQLRQLRLCCVAPENMVPLCGSLAKLNNCLRSLRIQFIKEGSEELFFQSRGLYILSSSTTSKVTSG